MIPVSLLAYLGLWFWARRRSRQARDHVARRRRKAARTARARLKQAAAAGLEERAAAAAGALRQYCADLWNLPAAGLTHDTLERRLGAAGADPEPILDFLERCDTARFAPGRAAGEERDPVDEARRWIDTLEAQR